MPRCPPLRRNSRADPVATAVTPRVERGADQQHHAGDKQHGRHEAGDQVDDADRLGEHDVDPRLRKVERRARADRQQGRQDQDRRVQHECSGKHDRR